MAGVAATWSMPNLGQASSRVGTESFTLEATKESVMSPDLRSRVDPRDFADGGKYRCKFLHLLASHSARLDILLTRGSHLQPSSNSSFAMRVRRKRATPWELAG